MTFPNGRLRQADDALCSAVLNAAEQVRDMAKGPLHELDDEPGIVRELVMTLNYVRSTIQSWDGGDEDADEGPMPASPEPDMPDSPKGHVLHLPAEWEGRRLSVVFDQ